VHLVKFLIIKSISSLWRWGFLDHTKRRTTVGRAPLDERLARRRDLYLTTHNTHNRQISMPPVGFKPMISAGERPQTDALDRAATGTGNKTTNFSNLLLEWKSICFELFLCPSSGVHCTHSNGICHTSFLTACEQDQDGTRFILILHPSCQKTCITYTIAVCTVKNSWWWTMKLSETCKVLFQN
jgi:hypothetical protein